MVKLDSILNTVFKTQPDLHQHPEQTNYICSWLDEIDIRLQELREPLDLNTSVFNFLKLGSSERQKKLDQDVHTFQWAATLEMLTMMLDLTGPSVAKICYNSRVDQNYAVSIHDILPPHSIECIIKRNLKGLGSLYNNLEADASD